MSIKMEPELRNQFMAVATTMHRPAAQIVRDLMRAYIDRQAQQTPNTETIAAMQAIEKGEVTSEKGEVTSYASTEDLYKALGI